MKLFTRLVKTINEFTPDTPLDLEVELEEKLRNHLHSNGFTTSRQVIKKSNRFDLICRENNSIVCLELKIIAEVSDLHQFDRYLRQFKDGLIVVCWQATFSVKDIFLQVVEQSPTPVALIELCKKYSLA